MTQHSHNWVYNLRKPNTHCNTIISKAWKQPKCPLADGWTNNMWHMSTIEYCCFCSATCHVLIFVTSWTTACQTFLSFTISWSLPRFMSIELVMLSNHLFIFLPLLPSMFLSIRVFFQWVTSLHQVAKILDLLFQNQYFQWKFRVVFLQDWLV